MAMLETPSRIWRRIEAVEGQDGDMPSLPSLPGFEDSEVGDADSSSSRAHSLSLSTSTNTASPSPGQSTPPGSSVMAHNAIRPLSSTSSTVRFASSIRMQRSKSSKFSGSSSSGYMSRIPLEDSFEVPQISHRELPEGDDGQEMEVVNGISDSYLSGNVASHLEHSKEQEVLLTEDPDSTSGTSSLGLPIDDTENDAVEGHLPPGKGDYSVSFNSEQKQSSMRAFDNVSVRRPLPRNRSPSHSRTTRSPSSLSSGSTTPHTVLSDHFSRSPSPSHHVEADHVDFVGQHEQSHHDSEPNASDLSIFPEQDEVKSNDKQHMRSLLDSEKELTFSSEEAPSHLQASSGRSSAPSFSVAFTSPVPSAAVTPTPAFQLRPMARPPNSVAELVTSDKNADPATPHARRRSFLLSVINSTARPRLSLPPPHLVPSLPNARHPFAANTPGPKFIVRDRQEPKISHPLAQTHTFDPSTPVTESKSRSSKDEITPMAHMISSASFISTASSHDLTMHPRANASFDPVTGAQGVGRFNAGKLNTYLHGLNRRLQEENEVLLERLRIQQEENAHLQENFNRVESGGVPEDAGTERWIMERDILERQVQSLKAEIEAKVTENEVVESALEEERKERVRDKDRWKERMSEVEKGVGEIVRELEKKLEDAEMRASGTAEAKEKVRNAEARLAQAEAECQLITERAEKAEHVMESNMELGGELREANEHVAKLCVDLRSAESQVKLLEDELRVSIRRADAAEAQTETVRRQAQELQTETQSAHEAANALRDQAQALELENRQIAEELRTIGSYVGQLETHGGAAVKQIEDLEQQLAEANLIAENMITECADANEKIKRLREEANDAGKLAIQMKEALEETEKKMQAGEEECSGLKAKLASMEHSRDRVHEHARSSSSVILDHGSQNGTSVEAEIDTDALEAELDGANKEIGRLNALLVQSPSRKAIEKAKDMRIMMLEKEREDLLERIQSLRNTTTTYSTPLKFTNASGMSPMHRHLLSMKTPKTPGGPLRDLTWLNNATGDLSASPLLEEITRLQSELDRANESIDDKLNRLEEAGLSVVEMTRALEDARSRVIDLEEQIAKASRKDQRYIKRLERARCLKCQGKVDLRGLSRSIEDDESSFEILSPDVSSNPPIDDYAREIEDLRSALSTTTYKLNELQLERRAGEEIRCSIANLEAELRRVQQDATVFGRDLKYLRAEKDRLEVKHSEELAAGERANKQNQTQLRLLNEQLNSQRATSKKAVDRFEAHICAPDEDALNRLKLQHNKECKGLIVQIRYLKAKYVRESSLRDNLGYQKQYLLVHLSRYERSEKRIASSIALPPSVAPRKRKSLRTIGLLAIFVTRARRASDLWREQRSSRPAITEALQEVRRRRAIES